MKSTCTRSKQSKTCASHHSWKSWMSDRLAGYGMLFGSSRVTDLQVDQAVSREPSSRRTRQKTTYARMCSRTSSRYRYFATRNTLPASSSSIFKCLAFVFVFGATCAFSYGRNGGALPRIAYLNFSYVSRLACTRRMCRGEPSTSSTTSLRNLATRSSTNADGSDVTAGGSPSSSLFVAASCAATSPMSFGSLSHPPPSVPPHIPPPY